MRPTEKLNTYILMVCFSSPAQKINKHNLFKYYFTKSPAQIKKTNPKLYRRTHGLIIKTVNQMISQGLLNGYGYRSPKEWHIREISLTREGKKKAKSLLSIKKLPLKY